MEVSQLRRRVGMVFQRPNPFPKSIFDNIAYGPRINGMGTAQRHGGAGGAQPAPRRAVGGGQGQAAQERLRPFRRPAAAAVHRARPGGGPGSAAAGRTLLRAGSHRHRQNRGAAVPHQGQLHRGDRHPQHAAGRAHRRLHRLLPDGQADGVRHGRSHLQEPQGKATEDYITGRFG